jgi:hypothetical protein
MCLSHSEIPRRQRNISLAGRSRSGFNEETWHRWAND